MSTPRKPSASAAQSDDPNGAIVAELRTMNRLLAAFTTRGMQRPDAITFLAGAGFGPAQISDVLGINPVTVRTALFRARKAAVAEAAAGNDARASAASARSCEGDVNGDV